MNLYRIAYERRSGGIASLTLAAHPGDVLRMSAGLIRDLGWLLSISETRALVTERPQLRLV